MFGFPRSPGWAARLLGRGPAPLTLLAPARPACASLARSRSGRRSLGATLSLLLLVSALVPPARAQVRVVRGERVRAMLPGGQAIGVVVAVSDTTLAIRRDRTGELVTARCDSVAWIEVSGGRHAPLWRILVGAGLGFAVGGLLEGHAPIQVSTGETESAQEAGPIALAAGAVGAWVGSRIRTERWTAGALPGAAPLAVAGAAGARAGAARPSALGPFDPGAHIRYEPAGLTGVTRTATVVRLAGDTLLLRPDAGGSPVAVPVSSLRGLEVSTGWHRRTGRGLLIGALVGTAVGGTAAALATPRPREDNFGEGLAYGLIAPLNVFAGAFAGAFLGGAAGAGLGALDYHERWRPIDSSLTASVSPHGTLRLTVTLRP